MPVAVARPADGCLAPVVLDSIVDDPDEIRAMARRSGPYFMPARYLVGGQTAAEARAGTPIEIEDSPAYLIGPVWRGDWAFDGEVLVDGAEQLLHLPAFVDSAAAMCDSEFVQPEQVFVNLTTPCPSQGFSHTDIPEFHGVNRSNAPGWLLQAMGTSRLFEEFRITIITAVTWFHQGAGGEFRYWPNGRDADSAVQTNVWNTGVVGDNDFMHHRVETSGPDDAARIKGMSLNTILDYDTDSGNKADSGNDAESGGGAGWLVSERDAEFARFDDREVRLSLSWKAKVFGSADERDGRSRAITVDGVLARFADELAGDIDGDLSTDVNDPALAMELGARFNGYRAD